MSFSGVAARTLRKKIVKPVERVSWHCENHNAHTRNGCKTTSHNVASKLTKTQTLSLYYTVQLLN
jgi:hypothetical protein